MKKYLKCIAVALFIGLSYNCSSVKVVDAWKSENIKNTKNKNFLVIARTSDNSARVAFESEMVKAMKERGLNATASYGKFPPLSKTKDMSEQNTQLIKEILGYEGFNAIVLTSIKEVRERKVTTGNNYYFNDPWHTYYPSYYGNFYGYYYQPYIYNVNTFSSTTYTSKTYYLESVAFNLDKTDEDQIFAVVTASIDDPKNAYKSAKKYTEEIMKALDKSK